MLFGLFGVSKKNEGEPAPLPEAEMPLSSAESPFPEDVGQVALDVVENEESVTILAPLAGVSRDQVDINLSRNILTISGSRPKPRGTEGARALVSECFFGPFSRSVILPENLALNKIRATMEDNLLTVSIPKLVLGTKSVKIERLSAE